MKKSMIKYSFRSLLSLVLMFSMFVSVFAADEPIGSIELNGSFTSVGFNNPIAMSNLALLDYTTQDAVSSMTPNKQYTISFELSDADGLGDSTMTVVLYNDPDSEHPINPASLTETNVGDERFVFTYSNVTNLTTVLTGEGYDSQSTTWELDLKTAAEGVYKFDIRVSKIAQMSNTWKLYAMVTDNASIASTDNESLSSPLTMNWYGEISLGTSEESVSFPYSAPNVDYGSTMGIDYLNLKYISNGSYKRLISTSDSTWVDYDNFVSATLVDDAHATSNKTQTFSIRVNDTGVNSNPSRTDGYENDYTQLTTFSAQVGTTKTRTDEAGVSTYFDLYISLSPSFQNGTYTGKIVVGIANDTSQ